MEKKPGEKHPENPNEKWANVGRVSREGAKVYQSYGSHQELSNNVLLCFTFKNRRRPACLPRTNPWIEFEQRRGLLPRPPAPGAQGLPELAASQGRGHGLGGGR